LHQSCTNLAPFRQKTTKNDSKLQQVRIPGIGKKQRKSDIFVFCFGAFKAKIRVRFPLAVPTFSAFRRKVVFQDIGPGGFQPWLVFLGLPIPS
jgi:hypothetical protein